MKLREMALFEAGQLFGGLWRSGWLLFLLPLLYLLFFGNAYSSNIVKDVPLLIYDQDQTAVSRSLVQAFADSERCRIVAQVVTQADMDQAMAENKALLALAIPPQFEQSIKQGRGATVLLQANSANNMFANAGIGAATEIVQTFSAGTAKKLWLGKNQVPAAALTMAAPVKLGIRVLNNPTTSYTNFMLLGLVLNGLQIAILLTAGPLLVREYAKPGKRENENTSASELVLRKMLVCWPAAVLSFFLCLGAGIVFFDMTFSGALWPLLLLVGAFSFLLLAISFFFSAIVRDEVAALQVPLLYIMPGLLFSGLSWPSFAMDSVAKTIAAFMPLTYTADAVRDLVLTGYSPQLPENLLVLCSWGLGLTILSIKIFSRRLLRLESTVKDEVSL
ncbi:MAG: ABC transporter permease [Selenomonadaceae bacterium]